jgi:hypothetical protein
MDYRNLDVTVTLKGEEWFALAAKLSGKSLSDEGVKILKRAEKRLSEALTEHARCTP